MDWLKEWLAQSHCKYCRMCGVRVWVMWGWGVCLLQEKVGFPHISPVVNLTGVDKLHGLAERVVGTESL